MSDTDRLRSGANAPERVLREHERGGRMEVNSRFGRRFPTDPMTLGRLLFVAWVFTFAVGNAASLINDVIPYLHISSSVLGLSTGVLFGCTAYYLVDGTTVWRLSAGALGLIASAAMVMDLTGFVGVFDGTAMWLGAAGMTLVLSVILHDTIEPNTDSVTGRLYFYMGLICIGIAVLGLSLAWAPQTARANEAEMALLLPKGIGVLTIGIRIGDTVDSAVPHE